MQYKVYNGSTLLATLTDTKSYTVSGLTPLTAYTFGVIANNGLRDSSKVTVVVTTPGVQLTIPKALTVGASVTLSYVEYALGLVPIGSEPAGDFGGTAAKSITATVKSVSGSNSVVELTTNSVSFSDGKAMTLLASGLYMATDGYKSIYYKP
jgi:uncharacterized membrane protein (GlpM family)